MNTFTGMVSACWWQSVINFDGYDNCDGFNKLSTYDDMLSALHGVSSFSDAFQSLTEFKDGITEERIYPNFPFSLEFPLPDVMLPCVDFNFLSLWKRRPLSQFDFRRKRHLIF